MLEADLREFKDYMRESVDQGRKQSLDLVLQKNSEIDKLARESLDIR